jgi:ParB-like chromosome segregation protein Spo0J|tara:strand:- start:170 stop:835 length:666 start_codon:yes stop_codon:yes gene_type:complete
MIRQFKKILKEVQKLNLEKQITIMNEFKLMMHEIGPFKTEPVDCVLWVKNNSVSANDYNPNSVAPPEMELLRLSISNDGYTQPIVSMKTDNENREVIDGFHRNRVGKECKDIQSRVHGYLPVVTIRETQENKGDRIASTIRHNRARGKHRIDAMSEIVLDLKKRNWSDKKISKQLGMDQDEVLRLTQLTGLSELFKNKEFSEAWEAEIIVDDYEKITDETN